MEILVAEDDPVSALVLRRTLEKRGHRVETVSTGLEALDAFERGCYRVVISDWMMPGMDGIELCNAIRGMGLDWYTYFILLTARTDREERLTALESGIDDYLEKPLDVAELTSRLRVADRLLSWELKLREANAELQQKHAEVEYLARHDSLTGALNRGAWFHAATSMRPAAMAIFDIDHFKPINDELGHPAGDVVLKEVARRIQDVAGANAPLGRVGGEEFGILLADGGEEAMRICKRAVRAIADAPFEVSDTAHVWVTVSAGVADRVSGGLTREDSVAETYEAADRALYRAKEAGRNRACLATAGEFRRSAA